MHRPGPALWLMGVAGSLAVHAALAWVLAATLRPDPVPYKAPPQPKISVLAHEGRVDRARPADAEGDRAAEAAPEPGRTGVARVPHSSAGAVPAPAERAAIRRADAERIGAAAPPAADVSASTTEKTRITDATPETASVGSIAPSADMAIDPVPTAGDRGRLAEPESAPARLATAITADGAPLRPAAAGSTRVATAPASPEGIRLAAEGLRETSLEAATTAGPTLASATLDAAPMADTGTAQSIRVSAAADSSAPSLAPVSGRKDTALAVAPAAPVAEPAPPESASPVASVPVGEPAEPASARPQRVAATEPAGGSEAVVAAAPRPEGAVEAAPLVANQGVATLAPAATVAPASSQVTPAAARLAASPGPSSPANPARPPEPEQVSVASAASEAQRVASVTEESAQVSATATTSASTAVKAEFPPPSRARPKDPPRAGLVAGAGLRLGSLAVPAVLRPASDSAEAKNAALAWSGAADTRLDPQSLAAIQSFMAPKPAGGAPSVRDGLDATLSGLPCSRLTAAFSPGAGQIEVRGHARDRATAAEAVERVRAAVGASIPVVGDILILPEPQCGVLDRVEALGLPQSTDQTDDPLVVGRAAQARYLPLEEGDPMVFALEAADYDAYIHVDYFDAAGNVTHLTPNKYAPLRLQPAGRRYSIGGGEANGSGIRLTIAPPFGKEIVTVIATTHPLHRGERPLSEDGGAYLAAMRDRIAELRVMVPGFRGEWAYMFLETFPRGGRPGR